MRVHPAARLAPIQWRGLLRATDQQRARYRQCWKPGDKPNGAHGLSVAVPPIGAWARLSPPSGARLAAHCFCRDHRRREIVAACIGVHRAREGRISVIASDHMDTGRRLASLRRRSVPPLALPRRSPLGATMARLRFRRSHDRRTEQLAFPVAEPTASPWCWAGKPSPPQ
jgi:hypothetical protein